MPQEFKQIPQETVKIKMGGIKLEGFLVVPKDAKGIVVFAHGSGSSRHSPRNQYVAKVLQDRGLATLLVDLLTPEEEAIDNQTRHLRFDIKLLARRLFGICDYILQEDLIKHLSIGYFGSSTGAAAALIAAASQGSIIKAIVSRGGRADLAADVLGKVLAPTLLIVGGQDLTVLELNKQAYELLEAEKKLDIVANATHLFEESGALEEVARLASHWFQKYLQ